MPRKPKTISPSPPTSPPAQMVDGKIAVVDLRTGAIVRLAPPEVDHCDPADYRLATDRDLAIGE